MSDLYSVCYDESLSLREEVVSENVRSILSFYLDKEECKYREFIRIFCDVDLEDFMNRDCISNLYIFYSKPYKIVVINDCDESYELINEIILKKDLDSLQDLVKDTEVLIIVVTDIY